MKKWAQTLTVHRLENPCMSEGEWTAALKLSTMWDFPQVRKNAIEQLGPLTYSKPFKRIELGNTYQVSAWVREGYRYLIEGKELDSVEMLNHCSDTLGWEDTAKIMFYRKHSTRSLLSDDMLHLVFKIPCW